MFIYIFFLYWSDIYCQRLRLDRSVICPVFGWRSACNDGWRRLSFWVNCQNVTESSPPTVVCLTLLYQDVQYLTFTFTVTSIPCLQSMYSIHVIKVIVDVTRTLRYLVTWQQLMHSVSYMDPRFCNKLDPTFTK